MNKPALIVMAAGMGSRYGGIKQIDPIGPNGEIIIDYSVYDALRAGFGRVVFVIRKEIEEAFRERVGSTIEKQIDTHYVFQELNKLPTGFSVPAGREKPWGTGHAILMAKEKIDGPFAVVNADDYYGVKSFKGMADYLMNAQDKNGKYDFSLMGFVLKNTLSENGSVARGVCEQDKNGYLVDVKERTKIQPFKDGVKFEENGVWHNVSEESLVSMNMWGFTKSLFSELESGFPEFLKANMTNPKSEFFIPEIVGNLVRKGKATVKVLSTDDKWFGVTYKEDKPLVQEAVRQLVAKNVYPAKLWS
ncbi:MAG: nucleotidyltransferase [Fibrobacteres bacterium]|nr:nucleotidyltransferase [Fibrobacterota bacterium]